MSIDYIGQTSEQGVCFMNIRKPTPVGQELLDLFEKITGRKGYSIDEKMEYYLNRFYDLSLPSSVRAYAKKRYLELEKIKFGKKR